WQTARPAGACRGGRFRATEMRANDRRRVLGDAAAEARPEMIERFDHHVGVAQGGQRAPRRSQALQVFSACGDAGLMEDSGRGLLEAKQRAAVQQAAGVANVKADPSGVRMHVGRLSLSLRDELLADEQRERQVREAVAVNVTQLATSQPKFYPAESVRSRRDA